MCTRVMWNTGPLGVLAARTMDWPVSTEPRLTVLPRGMARDGGLLGQERIADEASSLTWTSTYASVVTTIYDLGTADGMNERGLSAHMLYFNECDFGPAARALPKVHAALWVQYLLDQAETVADALALLDDIELVVVQARGYSTSVHVAVEDASGDSAVIEFVDGVRHVYHGPQYTVMTNSPPYDQQLAQLAHYDFDDATRETALPGNVNPRDRFVRAAYFSAALPVPADLREAAAAILAIARNVSVPFGSPDRNPQTTYDTEYRTVCDLGDRRYFFELSRSPSVIWLELDRFDLAPGAPAMTLDPYDVTLAGDVSDAFVVLDPVPF